MGSVMMTVRGCWFSVLLIMTGCMGPVSRPWPSEQTTGTTTPTGTLDFGWKLSGDRAVAPLQVFSDATRTWLQWLPGQLVPIILGVSPQGERVLAYVRQEPYTILDGHWSNLRFRSSGQTARARRIHAEPQTTAPRASEGATLEALPGSPVASSVHPVSGGARVAASGPTPSGTSFSVNETDVHLRQALTRWAVASGWRFQAEHWAVDVDIPISAAAVFSEDFVGSVQALLAATELADRPLQPCFYANKVLRIVPFSEPCDRTLGEREST